MEIGDLINTTGPVQQKLFTYCRYNTKLTPNGLAELGISDIDPKTLWAMDSTQYIQELDRVGLKAAEYKVKLEHFSSFY